MWKQRLVRVMLVTGFVEAAPPRGVIVRRTRPGARIARQVRSCANETGTSAGHWQDIGQDIGEGFRGRNRLVEAAFSC
jgi:hypothetical protein